MMLESGLTMSLPSNVKIERGLRAKTGLLHDSDFGIVDKKEIKAMADFVKNDKKNSKRNFNSARSKTNDYGSKKESRIQPPDVCAGTIEYKMSKLMADEIIKASKSKKAPQEILCNYVNTQCGLKGFCVKVIVEL